MKLVRIVTFAVTTLVAASPTFAGLVGSSVTGTLKFGSDPVNYFAPANLYVPVGYGNSSPGSHVNVLIGAGAEFGYRDGFNQYVANFTDTQLIITHDALLYGNSSPLVMTFTSSAFTSLSLDAQSFAPALTHSLVGNVITINWAGGITTIGSTRAVFNVGSGTGVPDGGSTALMFVGALLAGVVGLRRMKFAR